MKIGIIKEHKIPMDNRAPLSPLQCKDLIQKGFEIEVEPCETRCFTNEEYMQSGCMVTDNLNSCDLLLGIKEVKPEYVIANKKYLFFSHTKKQQPHNQAMLIALMEKKITLIDYECLTDELGNRLLGFGNWAGIVGTHNALLEYGKRSKLYDLPKAHNCKDYEALKSSYKNWKAPNIKIVVTGSGRVSQGCEELLNHLQITKVSPRDFLNQQYNNAVYTTLSGKDLYEHGSTKTYNRQEFHEKPSTYNCKFLPYTKVANVLLNGVYWNQDIPRLFHVLDIDSETWTLNTIADISCDEEGSVPITHRSTTIANPTYGIDKASLKETKPYLQSSIDIMAVDNLPNELPRDASTFFGNKFIQEVLPELQKPSSNILEKATITNNGELGEHFQYLKDYTQCMV